MYVLKHKGSITNLNLFLHALHTSFIDLAMLISEPFTDVEQIKNFSSFCWVYKLVFVENMKLRLNIEYNSNSI